MSVCRLCFQKADKHYTVLYSRKSREEICQRMSQLLDISTSNEPNYPGKVCRGYSDESSLWRNIWHS